MGSTVRFEPERAGCGFSSWLPGACQVAGAIALGII